MDSIFATVTEGRHNSSVGYNPDSDDESLPLKAPSKSSSSKDPTFLFPSINQVSECNLWAPLCQPGSIVVDFLTANRTIKTTVTCSSYLSAQYTAYLRGDFDFSSSYQAAFFEVQIAHRTPIGVSVMGVGLFCPTQIAWILCRLVLVRIEFMNWKNTCPLVHPYATDYCSAVVPVQS